MPGWHLISVSLSSDYFFFIFFFFKLLQQFPIKLGLDLPPFLGIHDEAQCDFDPVIGHDEIDRWLNLGLLEWEAID